MRVDTAPWTANMITIIGLLSVDSHMASPDDNLMVWRAMSVVSAGIIAAIAFAFLDGTIRWVALGIAALELVVTPRFMQWAAEQENA